MDPYEGQFFLVSIEPWTLRRAVLAGIDAPNTLTKGACGAGTLSRIFENVTLPASPPPRPAPPPDASYTLDEIARLSGVRVPTIRYYVAHDALPAPEFHSRHTRYDGAFLVRLRAVAALRRQKLRLPVIRPRLAAATREELLALAGYAVPAPAEAQSPSRSEPTAQRDPSSAHAPLPDKPVRPLPTGFVGPYRGAGHPTERWEHMELCPGVKLLVRAEADAEAWRVAREIVALFAAPPARAAE